MNRPTSFAAMAALTCLAGLAAGPAHAQVMPNPDATEVAKTPLRDLNIDPRDIPEVLQTAARNPYAMQGMESCDALITEIAALDTILGADYDIAEETTEKLINEGRLAQGVVGSIIPFRGIVREVSGAAGNERLLRASYTAGMVRRSFLKGWGLGRGCAYPARPKVLAATVE